MKYLEKICKPNGDKFTNQEPFIANEADCKLSWSGGDKGKYFRCYLCGHKFNPGDQVRWIFSNNVKGAGGNPMVCKDCDGPNEEVIEKWKAMTEEANHKFWWFTKRRD